ncbi:GYD domain-containing protein [Micromonospora sp. C31]|uniref:GYD domain-containing protein n=1 Tax=Micromonospora sp. C31 TaxID=2824876 RepID=UPI001B387539|nr:GYD domain-containing protein [Micromonospora sp. C31]MBQ1074887.1 GYD domain-containing protein [Micromonospora sp. C31]
MAKFLFTAAYTVEGINGLMRDGGTRRAEVIRALIENTGGRMESLYFALGQYDAYVICDLADQQTAVALAATIRAAGGLDTRIIPLLTPEDMDEALRMKVAYQPPGA